MIIVAIEYAKLKLSKVLSSYNNALCDISKLFYKKLTLETWGLWIFSTKCEVIFRFGRISFNMPYGFMRMPHQLDLGIGIHTCTAEMSVCGSWVNFSVIALLQFY